MPSTCSFSFDRSPPVYYSGETIMGRIQLNTTTDKSVRNVYINFEGEGKVRWQERRTRQVSGGKSESYTVYFRASETYINSRTIVFNEGTLPAGTHDYTFCIPLNLECPTSCVGKYGRICYELSLTVNRVFRFDNVFKEPITVIRQLNLNLYQQLTLPVDAEEIKYLCCWPCASGPIITNFKMPFGGYAPGQSIKYAIQIDNQSSSYDVFNITVKLEQNYKFTAHAPHTKTRMVDCTIARVENSNNCLRLSKRYIEGTLRIPSVPPTFETSIIAIFYNLKITVETGNCHNNIEMETPIVIGTVPLAISARNNITIQQPSAPSMPASADTANELDKPPSYDMPPSFEEAIRNGEQFIDIDVDERHRTDDFIPKYPMYSNFANTTMPLPPPQYNDCTAAPLLQLDSTTASSNSTAVNAALPNATDANNYGWRP